MHRRNIRRRPGCDLALEPGAGYLARCGGFRDGILRSGDQRVTFTAAKGRERCLPLSSFATCEANFGIVGS